MTKGRPRYDAESLEGTQLGEYTLERKLGSGAQSAVYLTREGGNGRLLAVKVFKSDIAEDAERVKVELRAAQVIRHPNVAQVIDYGIDRESGRDYVVMEFIDGATLRTVVEAEGGLPLGRAVRFAHEIAGAITACHSAGVVHRDLKPENVMVTKTDGIKVLDFGMALRLDRSHSLTATGGVVGTFTYMAPEAFGSSPRPTVSVDVWALGAILFELIAGRKAFPAVSFPNAYFLIALDGLPQLPEEVPEDVRAFVHRCLTRPREDRPSAKDAEAVLKQLTAAHGADSRRYADASPAAPPVPMPPAATGDAIGVAPTLPAGKAVDPPPRQAAIPGTRRGERAEDNAGSAAPGKKERSPLDAAFGAVARFVSTPLIAMALMITLIHYLDADRAPVPAPMPVVHDAGQASIDAAPPATVLDSSTLDLTDAWAPPPEPALARSFASRCSGEWSGHVGGGDGACFDTFRVLPGLASDGTCGIHSWNGCTRTPLGGTRALESCRVEWGHLQAMSGDRPVALSCVLGRQPTVMIGRQPGSIERLSGEAPAPISYDGVHHPCNGTWRGRCRSSSTDLEVRVALDSRTGPCARIRIGAQEQQGLNTCGVDGPDLFAVWDGRRVDLACDSAGTDSGPDRAFLRVHDLCSDLAIAMRRVQ